MMWNWRQRRARLLLAAAIVACGLALGSPGAAHAGWPLDSAGSVVLRFGASYRAAEATASCIHHGIDVSAADGAAVVAPLAGRVTFAGRVPAAGGGTVRAVTIATASGSLTLLPLATLSVASGAELVEGDAVGTLASGGDGSSAGTHLHVGLKRGDLYVDPLSALTIPAATQSGSGEAPSASAGATAQGATEKGGAGAPGSRSGTGAHPSTVGQSASGRAGSYATGASVPLRAAVPGARVAPGISIGGANAAAVDLAALRTLAGPTAFATQRSLVLPAPAAHAVGQPLTSGPVFGDLLAQAVALAAAGARVAVLAALGALAGVACLWPLWRRQVEGLGEGRVSAVQEDVAAAVGR